MTIPWQSFWLSLWLAAAVMPAVIAAARRLGLVHRPRADRWSTPLQGARPAPALMGGVGIYLTLAVGAALYLTWDRRMIGIAAGATLMFGAGLADDLYGLRPHIKMAVQTAAACLLLITGTAAPVPIPWLAALATIFWVIAVTNAVNLIDNMDGLASGVVMVSALTMALYGLNHPVAAGGHELQAGAAASSLPPAGTRLALLIAGACGGFLIYNFNPAKLFMGDCGSLLLGFLMSAAALTAGAPGTGAGGDADWGSATGGAAAHLLLALFVPVTLLAVPVFDTAMVSVVRRLNGRPISQGGRDHSSHRMVALGLSERVTVGVLYAISAVFGLLAVVSERLTLLATVVLAALMFGALALFGAFLGRVQVYAANTDRPEPFEGRGTLLGGTLLYKRQAAQLLLDIALIPLAWVAADLLRFEGAIPRQIMERLAQGLPYVIAAKIVCMAAARAYQGMWRYAGAAEVMAVLKGSTAGSLLAAGALALVFHLEGFSRTALIIDWMAFTGLAVGVRTGFVLLGCMFAPRAQPGAQRVVVVGADETGLAAVRELRRLRNGASTVPVAFLDEDATKHHRRIGGVPVVGAVEDLPEIVRRLAADAVVIAVNSGADSGDAAVADRAAALCDAYAIPRRHWVGLAVE